MTCIGKNDRWIIDSGCSHHMNGDKSKFITLTSYDGNSARFGNDAPCLIKGKGSIKPTDKISCDNAYYVEGLNYNLLSVSQLNKLGCKVEFETKLLRYMMQVVNLLAKVIKLGVIYSTWIQMMLLVLLQNLMTRGFGTRDYVMPTLII